MSEFTELNFRETMRINILIFTALLKNLGSEYFKNESEVFYEVKKKNFGLAALILMSLQVLYMLRHRLLTVQLLTVIQLSM